MKILIFGMGFIGRPLAMKCHELGHDVRAIKRHLTSDDINLPIDLDTLSLKKEVFMAEWADYEIWIFTLPPSGLSDYAETLSHLIEKAEQYGIKHLIYTSSTSVFGAKNGCFDESSSPEPNTENAKQIQLIEQRLQQSSIPNVDIVRLGGLYASERHPLNSLLRKSPIISNSNQWVNMIHRERVIEGISRALANPNGVRVRHFVETPHLSKRDFYQREAKLLGVAVQFDDDGNEPYGKRVFSQFGDWGF